MWEALARTRRQDRVLHGAAKAGNVVAGLAALPWWLLGQRAWGWLGALLARLARDAPSPPAPRTRPHGAPPPELADVLAELRRIPGHLEPSPTATVRKGLADLAMFILTQRRATINIGYAYPRPFAYHNLSGAEGARLAATVALHPEPRPGLIVAHGLLSSRSFDYVREIAVRAHFDWGFHVAAIDLRSFGLTELLTPEPSTAGWKEGLDVLAVARRLKELGATSVGAAGISLGGSAVRAAGHREAAEELLDGGVLSISGPSDIRAAIAHLDRRARPRDRDYLPQRVFDAMLLAKVRSLGWPEDVASWQALVERVVAPRYGVEPEEIYARASARNHIAGARVPTLALHAEDDEVVPVEQARLLATAAAGNPRVAVWILRGGGHAAFDALDREWAYTVYRTFFERFAAASA